jgi:rare lipoprotein A
MRRKVSYLNQKAPLPFWSFVGASCIALAWVVLSLSTRTVLANALLSRPAELAPVASPVASPTPVEVATPQPGMLHGVASWYGPRFNGRITASGERFDMYAMTACHPELPFGTRVRVTNLANHKSVVVRINDRGYLYDHRVLDLSYGAAKRLAMTKDGLAQVRIDVISMGHSRHNE